MKATLSGGTLNTLNNLCTISIPGYPDIQLNILPEITDSKAARYNDEQITGRSTPVRTYASSDNRRIGMKIKFLVTTRVNDGSPGSLTTIINNIRAIQSCVYPRSGGDGPYIPPPIVQINCGQLLGNIPLCVTIDDYSITATDGYVWDDNTLFPIYNEVHINCTVVYASTSLPNQAMILNGGQI